MATINLGSIKFKWQGAYNGATSYTADDVVSYNGSSYVCILASTGNLPTDGTYWNIMSQKGTDGTDITSIVGLAQGDLLYYDGSNWVRLGAGTSGQVLQTGGTGANPSWGTVSSDYVKLSDTSVSGNPGSVIISDIFTSDYKQYQVFLSNVYGQTSGTNLNFRYLTTGSTQVSSNDYYQAGGQHYYEYTTNSTIGNGTMRIHADSAFYVIPENGGNSTSQAMHAKMTIMNPRETGQYRWILAESSVRSIGGFHYTQNWGGYHTNTSDAFGGLIFFMNSGNMASADIKIYGIK